MSTIRGFVQYIFYPRTGLDKNMNIQFAGLSVQTQDNKTVRCYGNVPIINVGDYFEFEGDWEEKDKFKFKSIIRVDDDAMGATSMMIFIFGPKSADKIIHDFDDNAMKAWNIFKNHEDLFRDKVKQIKGIGKKKVDKAYTKYENHITVDILFNKFSKYGLTLNKALAIYAVWGNKSLENMTKNPYNLIYLDKIPFKIMDNIAQGYFKIHPTDERRVYAGVLQVMKSINMQGHTFIRLHRKKHDNETTLLEATGLILNVDKSLILEEIFNLIEDKKLVVDRQGFYDVIYLPYVYQAETGIATMVKDLISENNLEDDLINKYIEEYESKNKFKMADKQIEAVKTSVKNRFSIISGPPGSGKTTIIDCICTILNDVYKGCNIKLAAPTGKAAKRMSESTGMNAETVHRMLKYSPQDNAFTFNKNNPIDADVIIVDEFSMMSNMLTYQLLCAIPKNCMVILVGDKNQLPSVDAGKVLDDFLEVKFIPKVILDKVYRQGDDSTILQRALDMSHGIIPNLEDSDDFIFWEESNIKDLQEGLLNLYYEECAKYGIENVLLLTPMNKKELGVDTLNEIIQEHCNPYNDGNPEVKFGKRKYRKYDRVIQLTNEDEFGVYNGMVGTITDVIKEDKDLGTKDTIIVNYGDIVCEYTRDRFENIKLAYAITIHKSQGSEASSVIMVCHSSHQFMLRKKLIYTGMTRAKKQLHIVGEKNMIEYSMKNKEPIRNSKLKNFLMS